MVGTNFTKKIKGGSMEKIKLAVIGCGNRGREIYANAYGLKNVDKIQFVAAADPVKERRDEFIEKHGVSKEMVFEGWKELLSKEKFCDGVIIATNDDMHFEPTIEAIKKGYHILLEKPISNSLTECIEIAELAKKYNVKVLVCHVLRYTPFFTKIKEIIESGDIGEVVNIQHNENIGNFHFAHSFVRGNWRNSKETSPLILAKSCHDLDILSWLVGAPCKKVASFGELRYFNKKNAPEGSAERCLECKYIDSCNYSPKKIYYKNIGMWPTYTMEGVFDEESLTKELKTNQYGRCVYKCDNDVVDNMVTILSFDNGVNITFNLSAFTDEVCRTIKIMGTLGEIRGYDSRNKIEVYKFGQGEGRYSNGAVEYITPEVLEGGHGGGDTGLMDDFLQVIRGGGDAKTNAETSLQSHMMAFASEKSRVEGKIINIDEFVLSLKNN